MNEAFDPPAEAEPADRAIVIDEGSTLRLVLYAGATCVAAVTLTPPRALTIAGQMVAAAARRWPT